jgi:hypothetical protein
MIGGRILGIHGSQTPVLLAMKYGTRGNHIRMTAGMISGKLLCHKVMASERIGMRGSCVRIKQMLLVILIAMLVSQVVANTGTKEVFGMTGIVRTQRMHGIIGGGETMSGRKRLVTCGT